MIKDLETIAHMGSVKQIVITQIAWQKLLYQLLQMQRVGVNGFNQPLCPNAPIQFKDIEVWHEGQKMIEPKEPAE